MKRPRQPTAPALAPKQARSRESLHRLMVSTLRLLDAHGLEGATVPRIAAGAALTPGSVYRRFRDKDALLRTVILEALRANDAATKVMLTPRLAAQSLREIIAVIVTTGLDGFRAHPGLLRAMRQFYQSSGAGCRREIDEIQIRSFHRIESFLLQKRAEIRHPNPRIAVPLAMTVVSAAMREIATLGTLSPTWGHVMVRSERALSQELIRIYLEYLDVP